MIPLDVFGSESVAATLLEQVRWRDGVECPRCRSDLTVKNGNYGPFQRYLCKDRDRTFNDKIGTIFAHSKIALRRWLFSSNPSSTVTENTLMALSTSTPVRTTGRCCDRGSRPIEASRRIS